MSILKNKFFIGAALCILFIFGPILYVDASTSVSADLTANTTWDLAGSPYVLMHPITVPTGVTLTIDPGVIVTHDGDFAVYHDSIGMDVHGGNIIAEGTAEAAIVFDGFNIQIQYDTSIARLSHVLLKKIDVQWSSLVLSHALLEGLSVIGVGATATVDDVSLTGSPSGGLVSGSGSNLVMRNSSISNAYPNYDAAHIEAHVTFDNVLIESVSTCIHLSRSGAVDATNILIQNCKIGIASDINSGDTFDNNYLTLHHSEIAGNQIGLKLQNKPFLNVTGNSIHDNGVGAVYDRALMAVLKNNWWGNASGPYNTLSNPLGSGDSANEFISFVPWLTTAPFPSEYIKPAPPITGTPPDPTPTPTPIPDPVPQVQPARTPVLIVPGILGTELSDPSGKLWLNPLKNISDIGDQFMDPLQFNSDASPTDMNVSKGNVLGQVSYVGHQFFDYSDSLVKQFKDQNYTEGTDLFFFPYDWRYGVNDTIVEQLAQKIAAIKIQTGNSKVDIVAHSTGGLLVKKYAIEHPADNAIGKAIFVGVPNLGAPKAVKVLIQGDSFGVFLLADSEMKKIAQNLPVVYDLAPSREYYAKKGGYYKLLRSGLLDWTVEDLSRDETNARLVTSYSANQKAIAGADTLHTASFDNYDLRTSGIDLYAIDGCKTGTFGGVDEVRTSKSLLDILLGYGGLREVPGDGTVPLESAINLPVDEAHKFYALKADHAQMLGQDGIRQKILNILSGSTLDVSTGLITQDMAKCNLNGRAISIYSPLSIDVTDTNGNHSGLGSDGVSIENTIPNADYSIFGDHKFVYLPTDEGQTYTISIAGTGTGTFTLTDATIENNLTTSMQVFSEIPVTQSLKGSVLIGTVTKLVLDTDGDGTTDTTLVPSQVLGASESADFYPKEKIENKEIASIDTSADVPVVTSVVSAIVRSGPTPAPVPDTTGQLETGEVVPQNSSAPEPMVVATQASATVPVVVATVSPITEVVSTPKETIPEQVLAASAIQSGTTTKHSAEAVGVVLGIFGLATLIKFLIRK
jgi:pimeloyl-ACP methyl ester carboxylesterase